MAHFQEQLDGDRAIDSTTPQLSVIVPTFNRCSIVRRAIWSLQRQSFTDLEIIVVDDGSTDSTELVVKQIQSFDSRVRYIKVEHSGLPSVTVWHGLNLSRAEWVGWLSDDDEWSGDLVERHFKYVTEIDPYVGATYCSTVAIRPDRTWALDAGGPWTGIQGDIYSRLLTVCFAPPFIARRRYWSLNLSPRIRGMEDWDLNLRIARRTKVGFLQNTEMYRYLNSDGITASMTDQDRLQSMAEMYHDLQESYHEAECRSRLYWSRYPIKLPFCLRWYRLKYYARKFKQWITP